MGGTVIAAGLEGTPDDLTPALVINENKLPDGRMNLHDEHPLGFPSSR